VFRLAADALRAAGGDLVRLDGPQGHHAARVRRLTVGEALWVTDGAGLVAPATVRAVDRDGLALSLGPLTVVPVPTPRLVLVQALAKGDHGEDAVTLATEVGVDAVVPWRAARSVARWDADREARGLRRWQAAADEAAKQSRRVHWPVVAAPVDTAALVGRSAGPARVLVLHEAATTPLAGLTVPAGGEVWLVVGPEGGVAGEELAALTAAGAVAVRLGPSVLRTSSAGAVAAALVLAATGRWA